MPEAERSRRRRRDRGYEAGDDTDSTADDQRRRNRGLDPGTAEREPDRKDEGTRHHRRRRSHDPSSSSRRDRDRDGERDRDRDRDGSRATNGSSRTKDKGKQRQTEDGGDSDATEELPARFDNAGHKKTERGEDPVADRLEDLISGKGAAGKVFGNFVDGLFGPERKKRDH